LNVLWHVDPLLGNELQIRFHGDGFVETNSLWNIFPWIPIRFIRDDRIEFRSVDDRLEEKTDQIGASRSSDQNKERSDQIRSRASPGQSIIVSYYIWLWLRMIVPEGVINKSNHPLQIVWVYWWWLWWQLELIRQMLGADVGRHISCPDWNTSWASSVPPGNCRGSASN
jgi:hypothetical protein